MTQQQRPESGTDTFGPAGPFAWVPGAASRCAESRPPPEPHLYAIRVEGPSDPVDSARGRLARQLARDLAAALLDDRPIKYGSHVAAE